MDSNKGLGLPALFVVVIFNLLFSSCGFNSITLSQYISDAGNTSLVSPNGDFKLGFFSPGKSKARYVGIWFNKIPEQKVVWVANRATPIKNSYGVFKLKGDGNLGVFHSNQSRPVWSTNVSVSSAAFDSTVNLSDSGNLVLITKGKVVWQSFDYPTDTILPGMIFGWNLKTGINRILTSWKSVDDPAPGDFSAAIDTHSQIVIYKNSVIYRRTGPWNGYTHNGLQTVQGQKAYHSNKIAGAMSTISDTEMSFSYFLKKGDSVTIAVLDSFGISKKMLWHESQKWVSIMAILQDLCDEYTRCGANTICIEDPLTYCACLPGFERLNPDNWYLKCEESSKAGCGKGDGEGFVRLEGVKFPDATNSTRHKNISLAECERACLKRCNCSGYANPYTDDFGHDCILWYGELRDMRRYKTGQDFFLRVDTKELAADAQKEAKHLPTTNTKLVFVIVMVVAEMCLVVLLVFYLWRRKSKRKGKMHERLNHRDNLLLPTRILPNNGSLSSNDEKGNTELTSFDLSTIIAATNNFSVANKLGQGGFGVVYKGQLANGQEVAIKRLAKNSRQGMLELQNEVLLIAKLQHKNLVIILGYCIEKDEMMVIYEFMPNKSLDYFIFDDSRKLLLDWNKRFDIILGIARGILYLHEDSRLKIIHRDLKVSNILLDGEMKPKISDFGLARMFGGDQTQENTKRVVGTHVYNLQRLHVTEYALDGLFSVKSDVFSFGIILLEIISGIKNKGFFFEDSYSNLIQYTWEQWRDGMAMKIVDSCLADSAPPNQLERCIQVGLLCVQDNPKARPSMSSVVFMLSNEMVLPSPKKSTFSMLKNGPSSSMIKKECSLNQVTNTSISAR